MKKILKFFALASVAVATAACSGNKQYGEPVPGIAQSSVDSASYALGVSMGMSLKQSGIEPLNLASLYEGLVDGAFGNDLKVSQAELPNVIQTYITRSNIAMADKKTREQDAFFAENAKKDSVQVTESGLQYKIIRQGNDSLRPAISDNVTVNYTGTLLDGTEFDSTRGEGGQPVTYPLGGFIKGWQEGLPLIGEGGRIILWIPFSLAYGDRAMGPSIPKYSTLVFDVEILKVSPKQEEK